MNDRLQDVLFSGEEVLWQGKPQKLCFILSSFGRLLPAALIFLLFDGFFIGTMVATGAWREMWLFMIIFFSLHLMPVWSCVGKIVSSSLEHKNIIYAVTSRRIIIRTGIVGLDFEGIDYADINNIRVDVSLLERFFKVGSLKITTASGSTLVFRSVKDPYCLYKSINEIFIDMKSDVHYPNAYRPEVNPGYKTRYQR